MDTISENMPPQHSSLGMIEEGAALAEVASVPVLYDLETLKKKVLPEGKKLEI